VYIHIPRDTDTKQGVFMKRTRSFLILAAVLTLTALEGCSSPPQSQSQPQPQPQPQEPVDVVVVGSGLSGLSAAISAAENGASVVLVEKLGVTGGSSGYSGGSIGAVGTSVQARFNIQDSIASWKGLWQERQGKSPDTTLPYPDWSRVDWLLAQGPVIIDWMISQGVVYDRPEGYGVDMVERLHNPRKPGASEGDKGNGGSLIQYLVASAEKQGVEIRLETRAVDLILENKAVTGVVVKTETGEEQIPAGAVVLAAGGFAQSPELLKQFIPSLPPVGSVASPGTTGDGILMAEKAGAVLYESPWIIGLYTGVPGSPLGRLSYTASLYVDPKGRRVMNEAQHYALITNDAIKAGGVLYSIYDSSNADVADLIGQNLGTNAFKGSTLQELAQAAGIDPDAFVNTINTYNTYARDGTDREFGKDGALLKEVTQGPFYAVKVIPNIMGTFGGVKTQVTTGEVLNVQGVPITGLYAAGENANRAFFNQVYMTGGALAVAATTGKAAGKAAADFSLSR
jgi:fumarate reductase flavoprotein subunit